MRRFAQISLTVIATLGMAEMISLSALAADQNTYRPGHAYLKTAANSFEACEQQCQGDAQCRGWNFVRPNPRSQTGICEFNERSAMPVGSAISISGEINTSVDPLMSRAVPSGSRTVRVGTPVVPKPKPVQTQRGTTKVNRMPVPGQQRANHPAAYKVPQANRTPAQAPQMTPQQQQYRQKFLMEQQRMRQLNAQREAALRQRQQMMRPPTASAPQGMMPPQQMQQQRQQQAAQAQAAPAQLAPAQMVPAPAGPPRTMNGPMVQQSLYGSLHDDLSKNMTTVPRPQTAPDNLNNPDAPISTSRAAPTKPVQQEKITGQAIPSLAGG